MVLMPTGREIELTLRIDLHAEPISGSLTCGDGMREPFSGWIGLSAALERVRAGETPAPAPPTEP